MKENTTKRQRRANMLFACEFSVLLLNGPPQICFLFLQPLSLLLRLLLARADGAAWVRAALVRDLVGRTSCPTCSFLSCWAALTCSACASVAPWSSSAPTSLLLLQCVGKCREQASYLLCCLTMLCLVASAFVANFFYDTHDAASRCFALSQAPS